MTDLTGGLAMRSGLRTAQDMADAQRLMTKALDQGLETVRLCFVDQHGVLRGKALVASGLAGAVRDGIAMTSTLLLKDTSHKTVFAVWGDGPGLGNGLLDGAGDVVIVPDMAQFHTLPWSPHSAWLLCDLAYKTGAPIPFDPRGQLRRAVQVLHDQGCTMRVGLEVEFTLFQADPDASPAHAGYQYLTDARYGALEPVLDAIRRAADGLHLPVRSVEIEFGPGQVELTFAPMAPVQAADALTLLRAMVKQIAAQNGFRASFMCRPKLANAVPSGAHMHQSLLDLNGRNLFQSPDGALTQTASAWIAGLLDRAAEGCLLSTPTVNGYKRFQPGMLAPDRVQWGRDNKGAMLRALIGADDPASRIENRVAESAANPYLFLAGQIHAGLDGIARGASAPAPVDKPYHSDAAALPKTLGAAIGLFERSDFYRDAFGSEVVDWLVTLKRSEWTRYLAEISDWEQREYFDLF